MSCITTSQGLGQEKHTASPSCKTYILHLCKPYTTDPVSPTRARPATRSYRQQATAKAKSNEPWETSGGPPRDPANDSWNTLLLFERRVWGLIRACRHS